MGPKKRQHRGEKNLFLSPSSSQIFIHLLLIAELGGLWIEVHPDPGMMGGSLPFLFYNGLPFACTTDHTRFLSLLYHNRNEEND